MHLKRPAEIFQLFASTTSLAGVGVKLASVLEKRVGQHVIDVLRHLPIGLIDRSQRPSLTNVDDGAIATFDLLVIKHDRPPRGVRRPYRVFCENETGALELVFSMRMMIMLPSNCPLASADSSAAASSCFKAVYRWHTLIIFYRRHKPVKCRFLNLSTH